jgi:hypothetical protein
MSLAQQAEAWATSVESLCRRLCFLQGLDPDEPQNEPYSFAEDQHLGDYGFLGTLNARPSPSAMWLLPVPELPTAMIFSRRSAYSERASSITNALFKDGSAAKSKLCRGQCRADGASG